MLSAADSHHRLGAGATTACVLGALCPDLDIARTFQGWDVYLLHHQSGTHSLLGVLGCGILTGTVVRLFARRGRWAALCAAGMVGAASHVALDLISGADLRLFSPISTRLSTLPLFAMADPWLLGALVIGAALCSMAPRQSSRERPRHRTFLRFGAYAAIALIVAVKAAQFIRAADIERHAVAEPATIRGDAVFGSWSRWTFTATRPATIERWEINAWTRSATRSATVDRGLEAPLAVRSRDLPTVANLAASHDDTFARVLSTAAGHEVRWSALRYCRVERNASEPLCGLWFGGEYDAAGRPIAATVHVGSIVQRRGAGRTSSDNE